MDIKPIRTEADYQAALREVESLMTADFGTPEGDRLDVLATLVEAYEAKHFRWKLRTRSMLLNFRWIRRASPSRISSR
jgi:HTH-type transcriptional regulator/antitoxin HigA